MADNSLAARREARKRRILENSENRLKRITGNNERTKDGLYPECGLLNGPSNSIISEERINGPSSSSFVLHNREDPIFNVVEAGATIIDESESLFKLLGQPSDQIISQDKERTSTLNFFQFLQASRLHLVCFAIFVRLLYAVDCGFLFGESVFVPLCILEVTDAFWINAANSRTPSSSAGGILGALLLLSGITAHKVTAFTNCFNILTKLGKDFSVYIVSFVTFHTLMEWPG